jgi:hypothetical protein
MFFASSISPDIPPPNDLFTGRATPLGDNNQTRSARSGATIVRRDQSLGVVFYNLRVSIHAETAFLPLPHFLCFLDMPREKMLSCSLLWRANSQTVEPAF